MNKVTGLSHGRLALGSHLEPLAPFLKHLFERYKSQYPDIPLSHVIASTDELAFMLLTQQLDLAILVVPTAQAGLHLRQVQQHNLTIYIAYAEEVPLSRAARAFLALF